MQPALPPKPTLNNRNIQTPQNDEIKLSAKNAQFNCQFENRTDLPFDIIPHDYVDKLFTEKYDNKIPKVPIPEYTSWLPTSKVKEFINSQELIDGYIESIYEEDFKKLIDKLNEVQKSHHNEALKLQTIYNEQFLPFTNETIEKNENAMKNLKNFDDLQIEMYDVLSGLSIKAIINRYKKLQSENESKCSDLVSTVLSKDLDDDDQLDQLLEDYMTERKEWHLNKICLEELKKM